MRTSPRWWTRGGDSAERPRVSGPAFRLFADTLGCYLFLRMRADGPRSSSCSSTLLALNSFDRNFG
jgi:hypothetical protein